MGKQLLGLIIDLSKNLYPKNSDFETFSELLQKRESVDKKIFKLIVLQTYVNFPHYLENMKTYSIAGIYCWSGKYGSNFKFDNCRHAKLDVNESNVTFLKTNSLQGDQLEEGKDFRNPRFYSIDSHEKLMDDIASLNRGNPNNIYWSRGCKETN